MNQHLSPNSGTPDPKAALSQSLLSRIQVSDKSHWRHNGSYLQCVEGDESIQVGVFVRDTATEVSVELRSKSGTADEECISLSKSFPLSDDRLFTLSDPMIAIATEALERADMDQDFRAAVSLNSAASNMLADIAAEAVDVARYEWEYSINPDTHPIGLIFKATIQGFEVSLEYNPSYYSNDYQLTVNPRPLVSTDDSLLSPSREGWIAQQALFAARVSESSLQEQFQKLLDKDPEAASWLLP